MVALRPAALVVALLLIASLLVNIRYVAHTQDACTRVEHPRIAAAVDNGGVPVRAVAVSEPVAARRAPHTPAAVVGTSEDARFIIVTFATKGVLDFALNWVLHIRALKLPHMLGAMDDVMVEVCERWVIPVHAVHRDNPDGAHSREAMSGVMGAGMANLRGSDKGFAGLGVLKTLFIQRLLKDGRDVLISDTDTAWFKDPRPIVYGREPRYADFRHADLLISTDCIDSTDDESELNSGCWSTPVQKNTGMMFFRASNNSVTFVREWEVRARGRARALVGSQVGALATVVVGCRASQLRSSPVLPGVCATRVFTHPLARLTRNGPCAPLATDPAALVPCAQERLVIYTTCPSTAGAPNGKCEGYNDQNLLNEMIEGRPLGAAVWHDGRKNAANSAVRKEKCKAAFTNGQYGVPLSDAQHTPGSRRVFAVCMPDKLQRYVVGVLPTIEYANGHSFFVQQRFLSTGVWPTAVHVTFTWGDAATYAYGKLQRMKDFGMWKLGTINQHMPSGERSRHAAHAAGGGGGGSNVGHDDDSSHAEPGSDEEAVRRMAARKYLLITADGPPPAAVPYIKADYDQRAFQHVEWQRAVRERLQHALALALALNRTIILPEFACYCDRYFYRLEGCMIPGGHHATQLPFVCPFDHIFDSSHWYELGMARSTPAGRRFAQLGFEGHLYGQELRRAPAIANSRATLQVAVAEADSGDGGAAGGGSGDGGNTAAAQAGAQPLGAALPPGSSDEAIARALTPLQHVHVLQVSLDTAAAVFGGFAGRGDAEDFHILVRQLFGLRVAYCQKECRFTETMYESVRKKQRDPCVWLDGTANLRKLPGGISSSARPAAAMARQL